MLINDLLKSSIAHSPARLLPTSVALCVMPVSGMSGHLIQYNVRSNDNS